jgi:hypothetical protein
MPVGDRCGTCQPAVNTVVSFSSPACPGNRADAPANHVRLQADFVPAFPTDAAGPPLTREPEHQAAGSGDLQLRHSTARSKA